MAEPAAPQKGREMKKIGAFEYVEKNILGQGTFGFVYDGRCSCHGRVAIKKVAIDHIDQETKEDELMNLNHPNVVRLYHIESDNSFRSIYFILKTSCSLTPYLIIMLNHSLTH